MIPQIWDCDLILKSIFPDVIRLRVSKWDHLCGPCVQGQVSLSVKGQGRFEMGTEKEATWTKKERGELCSHKSRDTWGHQKLEETKDYPLGSLEGGLVVLPFQASDIQNCERINAGLGHPDRDTMWWQPWEINTSFNCFICISSFTPHGNPYKVSYDYPILRDEETKIEQDWTALPDTELAVVQLAFKLDQSHAGSSQTQNTGPPVTWWQLWLGSCKSKCMLVPAPHLLPKGNMFHI